jgi:PPOX class F420-dependent enzyme/OxyR family protein
MATLFSQKEIEYIKSQRLPRIATAAAASSSKERGFIQPDVVPIAFDFDGNYFYIGGMNILKSTKYKSMLKNNKVALVIDDLKTLSIVGETQLDFTLSLKSLKPTAIMSLTGTANIKLRYNCRTIALQKGYISDLVVHRGQL